MIRSFKDLLVNKKAFEEAMRIFDITKRFPNKANLASQLRAASCPLPAASFNRSV